MRTLPQKMIDALQGSSVNADLVCNSWYDNRLVAPNLPVSQWSLSWDRSRENVQGQASFTVNDPTGKLAPWGLDEPLAVGGSRVQTTILMAGETLDLGWYLVTGNSPGETWRFIDKVDHWATLGSSIPVEAEELTRLVEDADFISPESTPDGSTCLGEIQRLVGDYFNVTSTVEDKPAPSWLTYEKRMNTVNDLLGVLGARGRMTGDGQFEVYEPVWGVPVWTAQPGDISRHQSAERGIIIELARSQSRNELVNGIVSKSTAPDGQELQDYALVDSGPLRWGGPFGEKPGTHNAIATTQAGVKQDAETTLQSRMTDKTTEVTVLCAPDFRLQVDDMARVMAPVVNGQELPLDGMVKSISISGGENGLDPMKLVLDCRLSDVQRIGQMIR